MFTQRSTRSRRVFALTALVSAGLLVSACSGVVAEPDADASGDGDGEPEVTLTLVTAAIDGTPNAAVQDWFLDEIENAAMARSPSSAPRRTRSAPRPRSSSACATDVPTSV